MIRITSLQNPLVKYIVKLQHKSAFRRKEKKFVVEGVKETLRAAAGGFVLEKLIVCPEILKQPEIVKQIPAKEIIEVSPKVYEHIAYRGGTEGLMAVGLQKDFRLHPDCLKGDIILVAENIQKPGNLGALLRTADAVGTACAVFIDPRTDLYNPNVIRASLGTLFTQPVAVADLDAFARFKKDHPFSLYAATLQNAHVYWKEKYIGMVAVAVGAEDKGLSEEMRKLADRHIYIPMRGMADSLNVSVSAAVILYEVLRQKIERAEA